MRLEKAKITLEDCLACSGCVTSAEAVLISQQSIDELLRVIDSNKQHELDKNENQIKQICFSISPQARASLAVKYNLDAETCGKKLCAFLTSYFNASFMMDTTFSRDFSLIESGREFVHKYRQNANLTLISSACPGWICYAEKTHGNFILPHISTVKSPQQIMGALVKDYLCKNVLHTTPDKIYHVTIMPCFDKKLEASRKDFYNETAESKDVDCVLSTVELEELLEKERINLNDIEDIQLNSKNTMFTSEVYNHAGGGSGGYLQYVLTYAAKELFNHELSEEEIVYKQLKNTDFKEVNLVINNQVKLKFALAYGFRNIQNIVQKLKKHNCPYQYVEIMACPSGKL